jgi:hypothetical protein
MVTIVGMVVETQEASTTTRPLIQQAVTVSHTTAECRHRRHRQCLGIESPRLRGQCLHRRRRIWTTVGRERGKATSGGREEVIRHQGTK